MNSQRKLLTKCTIPSVIMSQVLCPSQHCKLLNSAFSKLGAENPTRSRTIRPRPRQNSKRGGQEEKKLGTTHLIYWYPENIKYLVKSLLFATHLQVATHRPSLEVIGFSPKDAKNLVSLINRNIMTVINTSMIYSLK